MNVSENKNQIESFINHPCTEMIAYWNCKTEKAVTTARAKSDFLFDWNSLHARLNSHSKAGSYKKKNLKKYEKHLGKPLRKNSNIKDTY